MFRKDDIILCRKMNCKAAYTQPIPYHSQGPNCNNTYRNNLNDTLTAVRNDLSLLYHERWAQHLVNRNVTQIVRNDMINQIPSQVSEDSSLAKVKNTNSIIESAICALRSSPSMNLGMISNRHKEAISFDDHKLLSEMIFRQRTMRNFKNFNNVPFNRRSHYARSA